MSFHYNQFFETYQILGFFKNFHFGHLLNHHLILKQNHIFHCCHLADEMFTFRFLYLISTFLSFGIFNFNSLKLINGLPRYYLN